LEVLWRREMVTGAYAPRWVRMVTREGGRGWAIAFVINHAHARYAGALTEARIVESISRAKGPLGLCASYLPGSSGCAIWSPKPLRDRRKLPNKLYAGMP
jgi:cation transport protein ChaC